MKKLRIGKWLASLGMGVAMVLSFILATGGGILSESRNNSEADSDRITASAATVNSNYDMLVNGSSYYYSDETKVNAFRAGTADTDVSSVVVNTSSDHGTAANPYVINTVDQWNYFATDTTNATKTSNVFVLGSDLDFSGKTFKPVPNLSAKFYGTNHILKNITHNFKSGTTYGAFCGVFCKASATAIIADISLKDVSFSGCAGGYYPYYKTTSSYQITSRESSSGFICGEARCSIMNCHVAGRMTDSITDAYGGLGGIAGRVTGYTKNIYMYRCSVSIDMTAKCTSTAGNVAALIADLEYGTAGYGVSVYDCLAVGNYTISNYDATHADTWFGGAVHIGRYGNPTSNATPYAPAITHNLENVVVYSTVTDSTDYRRSHGSLINGWTNTTNEGNVTFNIKNTYSSGLLKSSGSTYANTTGTFDMKPVVYYVPAVSYGKLLTPTVSNSNWYGNSFCYQPWTTTSDIRQGNTSYDVYEQQGKSANATKWTSQANMYANVKDDATFPAKIWVNKGIINNAYMTGFYGTAASKFTIEESPVRNPLKVTVSYYNYTTDLGDDQYSVNGSTEPIEVKAGESLYEPAIPENRVFLGWTTDKTGASAPFKAVPTTMLGDNKLYAVWGIDQSKADISVTGTGLTGDDSSGYELVYNGNGGSRGITLTANLTAAGMDDPEISYQWKKNGNKIESGGTAKTFKVENVPDSGDYTVEVNFRSKTEPLFTGTTETVTAVKATVKPAPLTYRGATFKEGEHPYSGAPYETAVPEAVVVNADGIRVEGTTQWTIDLGKFNDKTNPGSNLADGKETKEILFKPDEKYNGNYGVSVPFDATFEIEFLKFIFSIPRINDMKLEVNLEYGQHYTYNNVVTMFEEAFKPYLGNLAGNTPAFMVNGQPVKINDYRKLGTGGSTTAYSDVKQSYTIEVAFVPQSYTVTYDARNEGVNTYDPVTVGHGIRLAKPVDPTYGNQLFLGWFYEATDDIGNKSEVAWNFDSDRVTQALELYAKWLNADTLADLEITVSPIAQFIAKQTIDPSMLTVTAVYEGTAEGQTLRQKSVLTSNQYTIEYEDGKSALHAKADPNETTTVTISYTFKGQTVTKTLNLNVEKLKVDTAKLKKYFKDTAVVVDPAGMPQKMKEIDPKFITQELPDISGCTVTYKYFDSNENEITDLSLVKDVGTYYVRAYFEPKDVDFDAPYIQAKFQIVPEKIKLTVDWGETEFVYNGKEQLPVPAFKDERGESVTANFTLTLYIGAQPASEGVLAIKARSDYSVLLELEDLAYELDGESTKAFVIRQASLKVPAQIKPFPYRGTEYNLNLLTAADCETYFEGFDLSFMEVKSGEGIKGDKGKDASRYNAIVILKDPDSARFEDGSAQATMNWQIEKAKLTVDWNSYEFYLNNGIQTPKVIVFYEFYGDDADLVDYATDIEYSGDINAMQSGEYSVTVIIKPEAAWAKNYELDGSKTCKFVILPKAGMVRIKIVWDSNTLFEYNGGVQRPSFRVLNGLTDDDITDQINASEFRYNEEAQTSKYAGDYKMTLSLRPGSNYFLPYEEECYYTITLNANGEGAKPDDNNPVKPPNGGGDNPSGNTNELPLWQLIVGGISAVLFAICASKAFGEYGKLKAAKKEAKELAEVSYAVTYSFAPAGLMAISFLGAGENVWTAVACSLAGLFVISFAAMLLLSKKRKAAELVVKREKARIEEEKEYAQQEEKRAEQQRRDEEMKMMFAAMQQNYQQPQVGYEDMQNMIASAMTAFLPVMQQSLQALPPAGDTAQYAAPAPAPQQYAAPASGEADELRAQMAQQQARMEAQMAQQQELINQLLQKQGQPAAPAQAYDPAEEAAIAADAGRVELLSQFGDGETPVSLEESYGKLSDDLKRYYYEIGCYIMERPNVMQNDGKYAVLFKYRGKTLFKLSIKNDAPVLTYILNGAPAEQRVPDENSLAYAKQLMSMCIAQTDKEIDG